MTWLQQAGKPGFTGGSVEMAEPSQSGARSGVSLSLYTAFCTGNHTNSALPRLPFGPACIGGVQKLHLNSPVHGHVQ